MTASPLLPPGVAGHTTETEATGAELRRMTELALSRGARAIAIGRGRSPVAARAAAGFARRFQATGGSIVCAVTWPESAASWLRQATRFATADPDLWVMAGPPPRPGLPADQADGIGSLSASIPEQRASWPAAFQAW